MEQKSFNHLGSPFIFSAHKLRCVSADLAGPLFALSVSSRHLLAGWRLSCKSQPCTYVVFRDKRKKRHRPTFASWCAPERDRDRARVKASLELNTIRHPLPLTCLFARRPSHQNTSALTSHARSGGAKDPAPTSPPLSSAFPSLRGPQAFVCPGLRVGTCPPRSMSFRTSAKHRR